jgi:Mor family transcriptional regulator
MKTVIFLNEYGIQNKRRFSSLSYKNGRDILPPELLSELQKYIQGEIIYIPREEKARAAWGQVNGTRIMMDLRNKEIYRLYKEGFSIDELMDRYSLSEDSIRKIIYRRSKALIRPGFRKGDI